MRPLLTLAAAAAELDVPLASLRTAAARHGLLVRMGRAIRIDPETLPELVEKCRGKPQDPVSTSIVNAGSITSATVDDSLAQARATAAKLTRPSRDTSPKKTDPRVAPLHRIK